MTPELRTRVPYEVYRSLPGVRISDLKEMRKSPLHLAHRRAHPKSSPSLSLGSAAHVAILEPERFERDHVVWGLEPDQKVRREGTKVWDAFQEDARATMRTILTKEEHALAIAMRDAVRGHRVAMRYLTAGDPEVTLSWEDVDTGLAMKGRADWVTRDEGFPVVVGLKTTRDITQRRFGTQAAQLGYHLAWAAYADGYRAITRSGCKTIEIVVESAPPHDVGVFLIDSQVLEQGRNEYRDLLARYAECEASGVWPGSMPDEVRLALPAWAYEDEDEDGGIDGIEGATMKGDDDE